MGVRQKGRTVPQAQLEDLLEGYFVRRTIHEIKEVNVYDPTRNLINHPVVGLENSRRSPCCAFDDGQEIFLRVYLVVPAVKMEL